MFVPRTGMCGWLHFNNINFINTSNLRLRMANFFPPYRCDKYIATQDKIMAQGKLTHLLKMYQPAHMKTMFLVSLNAMAGWVGQVVKLRTRTHTHPISVKQNNGIQVSSHVWSIELSWAVSHVKVEHISSDLKMLQTQFLMVEKVKVSKTTMHFSQQRWLPKKSTLHLRNMKGFVILVIHGAIK